jgi:hypothetical protein
MGLKQEMRQLFEKRSSMDFNIRNSGFEDGLLEKIINLAFTNLCSYSKSLWSITAVKSPLQLQKLYRLVNDSRINIAAIALLISDDTAVEDNASEKDNSGDLGLLLLSLTYAAKYYCIDSINITNFDRELIIREFALNKSMNIAAIKCLGIFNDESNVSFLPYNRHYSDIVRII